MTSALKANGMGLQYNEIQVFFMTIMRPMDSSTLLRIPLATYIGTKFQYINLTEYDIDQRSMDSFTLFRLPLTFVSQ